MSSSPDPQTSAQPPENSTPVEPEASSAARLLEEIRERMERLEGNLSLRERRLARVERALREADGKLQAERARLTTHRESLEQGLPQQLRERDEQLEAAHRTRDELEERIAAHLSREREMLIRIELLTQERNQTADYLRKTHGELEEVRLCQHELESQLEDINRRRSEWEESVSAAAPPGARLRSTISAGGVPIWIGWQARSMEWLRRARGGLSGIQRACLAVTAVALPILCVVCAASVYRNYPRTYSVRASITGPAELVPLLEQHQKRLQQAAITDGLMDFSTHVAGDSTPGKACLLAKMSSRDREDAQARLDQHMRARLADFAPPPLDAATRPATQGRREQLQNELRRLDALIVSLTTRPAAGSANPTALLAGWQQMLDERKALDAAVAGLDVKLQQKPPQASEIQLTPEQLTAAVAADPRLQADSEVLAQRETRLAEALRRIVDDAKPAFAEMARAAADSDKYLDEALAARQDPDVRDALQAIRSSLASCAQAAVSLAGTWQAERTAIDSGKAEVDMGARYKAVDDAARQFVESTSNSLSSLRKALAAISQSGDQPAPRMILHNDVARRLQPALDARETLAAAVRQVITGENVELATLVQGVSGLRHQVQDRRARLEQDLRDRLLTERRAVYEQEAQQLRVRRDELARKAVGMDSAVVRSAAEALSLLGGSQAREVNLAEAVELTRRRPQIAAELSAIDRQEAEIAAAAGRLGELSYSGPVAEEVTDRPSRIRWTLAGGFAPLLLFSTIAALFLTVRVLRSRSSLDDYTKALSDHSPRNPALRQSNWQQR